MKKGFSVPDISCGHCVERIRKQLESSVGVRILEINLEEKTVFVETDLPGETVLSLLEEAGYPAIEIPE